MARCPSCNKFPALETQEPEVQDGPDIDDTGHITASVRLVRVCQEDSEEIKEANFDLEADLDEKLVEEHHGEGHELEASEGSVESTESGGGRYKKNMIGVSLDVKVTCKCGKLDETVNMKDELQASGFDELV